MTTEVAEPKKSKYANSERFWQKVTTKTLRTWHLRQNALFL